MIKLPQNSLFTLKAFKSVKWMSEETLCFTAKLCLAGKVIAEANNDGHGGCTFVRFISKEAEESFNALNTGMSAEEIVDALSYHEENKKAFKSTLKRVRKDSLDGLVFLAGNRNDKLIEGWRTYRTTDLEKAKVAMIEKYESIIVLNDLPDETLIEMIKESMEERGL